MAGREGGRGGRAVENGDAGVFGVGAGGEIDYVCAGLKVRCGTFTCGDDGARGFAAEDFGFGGWIGPLTEIAVNGLLIGELREDVCVREGRPFHYFLMRKRGGKGTKVNGRLVMECFGTGYTVCGGMGSRKGNRAHTCQ